METSFLETARLRVHCWAWGPADGIPVLAVHGNLVSGRFFKGVAEALGDRHRVVAPDLRAFGRTEHRPVDATRGLRDWSDDVRALVEALGWAERPIHLMGWSLGGGVALQYLVDHPGAVASLTLLAPISPFGFGGTKDIAGTPCLPDFAGSGAGTAAPDFVRRLGEGDASRDDPASAPREVMRTYFWSPKYAAPDEDELIGEVLRTWVGDDGYPGDQATSPNWPGIAPGRLGVNNAMAPCYCDLTAVGELDDGPPVLWIRGDEDAVISDASGFDLGTLGRMGVLPGWPGEDVFPSQPMIGQTRAVLDRYRARGGHVREVVLASCGHGPPVERPADVARLFLEERGRES
jgi:pimeloyl-ACP methyl ester carboxylesterase